MNCSLPHLCFIQSSPVWGAVEEYLSLLADGLNKARWRVTIIYPEASHIKTRLTEFGQELQQIALPLKCFTSLRHLAGLKRTLQTLQPDIVHLNDPGLVGMVAAILAQVSHRVLTFHTPSQSFHYRPHIKLLQRWVLHQGWQFIVIAPINKSTLQNRYAIPAEKISVIEYGLNPNKFQISDDRQTIRTEFKIRPDCILLGCVARLAEQKNHALLLNAYASLPDDVKAQSHLLLVGQGALQDELEQQVKQLGLSEFVTFTGYRQDIPQLLQAMDCFVLSSNYEGLPFAVLEAMAMGLPVVATAVDGIRDAIIPGETGLVVPPGQMEPLRDAIAQLILNPEQRQRFGASGQKRFFAHYTAKRMVQQTEDLYLKLLSKAN